MSREREDTGRGTIIFILGVQGITRMILRGLHKMKTTDIKPRVQVKI
jgi:hypothetical protein